MTRKEAFGILQDFRKCTRDALKEQNENESQNVNVPYPLHIVDEALRIAIEYMKKNVLASEMPICTRICTMREPELEWKYKGEM